MHIIAGQYKNRNLISPKGGQTRPTSSRLRETLFNICKDRIEEATFLDLFAGSGAIGFEALSRGAAQVVLVDSSKDCGRAISKNVELLNVQGQARLICSDVFHTVKKLSDSGAQFDLIYADPPYEKAGIFNGQRMSFTQQLLFLLDALPLLKEGGYLFIEDIISKELSPTVSLKLVSSRRVGDAQLCEFKKVGCASL